MYIHLLLLAFPLLSFAQPNVSGQLSLNYSVLNDGGRTPCDMQTQLQTRCSDPAQSKRQFALYGRILVHPRDPNKAKSHAPTANSCTCNNLFFNVWSACLISQGNTSWVCSSSTWTARCQNQSLGVDALQYSTASPMPEWAYHAMPNNASFDILAAISEAESNDQSASSHLQIIVPVVVGASVALLAFVCFWVYRRRHNMDKKTPSTDSQERLVRFDLGSLLFGARKVRVTQRNNSWEIDHASPESFELLSTPHSGHLRLPSASSAQPLFADFNTAAPKRQERVVPGLWRNMQKAGHVLVFWKPKPIRVKSRSPDPRFDIDAVQSNEKTRSKLKKHRPQHQGDFSPYVLTRPISEHDPDSDVEDNRIVTQADPFIASNPSSVLLISHRGADFTVESGGETASEQIEVVPPSPSEESQRIVWARPVSEQCAHPRAPPAPNYPAPLPPASPRRRDLSSSPSSRHVPLPETLSPPHTRQPSNESTTSVDSRVSQPPEAHGQLENSAPPHTRQLSNESTTSVNSRASRRLPQPPIARNPSQNDTTRPLTLSQSVSPRARPLPLQPSFEKLDVPAPPYNPRPARHESVLASSPIQHHRLLSEEQLSSPAHQRMISGESSHVEPAVLFAGPVRAAGYMSPVASSDSLNLIQDHLQ